MKSAICSSLRKLVVVSGFWLMTSAQAESVDLFTLQFDDLHGQAQSMANYKGKPVVVNFWATWCPPCVAELPELQKISEEYKDKEVEVIGVLHDGIIELGILDESIIDNANTLMQDKGVNYRVILPDEYLQTEFIDSMQYFPTTFFLDSEGNLVETVVGANNFESWGKLIDETLEKLEN